MCDWRVTRSLVSYDILRSSVASWTALKGHQIIGELRHWAFYILFVGVLLKGHQIIGELRQVLESLLENLSLLKGHQIIGELRLECSK